MKNFFPWDSQIFHNKSFWLLVLTAALATVYMALSLRANDIAHLGMSALFFVAVYMVMEEKTSDLVLKSDLISKILGLLIIILTLWHLPLSPEKDVLDPILRLSPFTFGLGISLIASGYHGIKQYWQPLIILFLLGGPSVLLANVNPSPLTARFAGFVLQSLNLDIKVSGIYILISNSHIIEVYKGCSGMEAITYLLGLSVIMLILFPVPKVFNTITLFMAVIIAFVINGLRVVAMSLLVNTNQMSSFKYWHEGEGSLFVGMVAIVIFLMYYFCLIKFTNITKSHQSST